MKVISYYDGINSNFRLIIREALIDLLQTDKTEVDSLIDSLFANSQPIKELESYLKDIEVESAVIEENYIDRDFLDDYVSYYARNFRNNVKRCCRVHFFSKKYTIGSIEKILANPSNDKVFSKSYLGFVVIRPLRKTVVGTTCLVSYKHKSSRLHCHDGRHYLAVCKKQVSFFGIPLEIECTPFQEQDSNVAACATCALWSAFNVSAKFFGNKVLSPSAITTLAMENSFSVVRKFPNHKLPLGEMLYAIRKVGLEPVVVEFGGNIGQGYKFLGNVYAYLNLGVPVIAIVEDVEDKRNLKKRKGLHAIVINGYHISRSTGPSLLFAARIDKIYANDDQRVPGARFQIDWTLGKTSKAANGKFELVSRIGSSVSSHESRRFVPRNLIIPIYHKIRVDYDEIWEDAYLCDQILQPILIARIGSVVDRIGTESCETVLQWDITLRASNEVKKQIREDKRIAPKDRILFATEAMPRFLWSLRVLLDGKESVAIYVDATDSGQGLCVVARVFYDDQIQRLAMEICAHNKQATKSVIFKTLCLL